MMRLLRGLFICFLGLSLSVATIGCGGGDKTPATPSDTAAAKKAADDKAAADKKAIDDKAAADKAAADKKAADDKAAADKAGK